MCTVILSVSEILEKLVFSYFAVTIVNSKTFEKNNLAIWTNSKKKSTDSSDSPAGSLY